MTKDEPTPPVASEAKQPRRDEPPSDGSRVSGNMLKDDQDAARTSARTQKAKKAKEPKARADEPGKGRVSGNMYKDDQDAARAAADAVSR